MLSYVVGWIFHQSRIIGINPRRSCNTISSGFKDAANDTVNSFKREATPILDKMKLRKHHISKIFALVSSDIKNFSIVVEPKSMSSITSATLSNMVYLQL